MVGVALHVDQQGLKQAYALTERLSGWQIADLAEAASELMAGQSKNRIEFDKAAPDGTPWDPWSAEYAVTRHGGHSLLRGEGPLLTSIQSYATADEAIVGSNLDYAAVHQGGSEDGDTPARPYLGLSDENEKELTVLIIREAERMMS